MLPAGTDGNTQTLRNAGGKSPAEVRQMFGRISSRYDFLNHFLSFGLDILWRRRAAREVAGLGPNDHILDCCTGTGDLALAFARSAPQTAVLALDFTPEMVAHGPSKAQRAKRLAVHFGIGDTLRLPVRDQSMAAVGVAFGIRNVGDLDAGLRELSRVVRPGGKVIILEFTKPGGWLFGQLYMFYFKYILPLLGRFIATTAGDAYRYLPQSVQAFAGPEEMKERMQMVGLINVRAEALTFGTVHLYVGVK